MSLDSRLTLAAEGISQLAKEAGQRVGLQKGVEGVTVLERALAIAWCDAAMFKGANDSDDRFNEAIAMMITRIAGEMRAQRVLRRGHRPT